jgi:outer membrane protein assembly factor BamD (BamD/ComL family)
MEKQDYLDFELRIEKKGQRYQASVVHSPCGEASYTFRRPFSDLELENFVLRLGGARRGTRRITTPEMQAARQFGSRLFEAVFCDDIRSCFISSQNEAKHQGLGLRLKLRLETPELINIPWEYLYDASLGRFLSLFEDTPVVRYIDVRERIPPLAVKPPLSVLVMVSSPTDYPTLDVAREQANLQEALRELADEGLVTLRLVEKATLPALADCLLRGRYHVFHYIGHGGFDEQSQDGVLVLEGEQGRGQWASGERLAVLLGNQPTMRLVILNACEGTRTSCADPFAGTATTLVRTGRVPAVVAMQFAITDEAAIIFARGFYAALAVGRPVDAAVTQARLAIFASGNDVEWGTPVLYMRAPDGRIFDVAALSLEERAARQQAAEAARAEAARAEAEVRARREREAAERRALEQRQTQLAALYEQATTRLAQQDWAGARDLLAQIQEIEPGYRDIAALLDQAQAGQARAEQLAALLAKGAEHLGRGEWSPAAEAYRQVLALVPEHPEASACLAKAEHLAQVMTLFTAAQDHLKAGRWSEAIAAFQAVLKLVPTHAEAARQLAEAQTQLERQQAEERKRREEEARQAELARLYTAAQDYLKAGRWSEAIAGFQAVLKLVPTHAEATRQLAEAQAQLARQQAEERKRREEKARQAELARLYAVANEADQAKDWAKAIESFRAILRLDPSYRDAPARLAQAQEALAAEEAARQQAAQLAKLYAQALAHLQAQHWQEAIEGFRAVVVMDPGYGDPTHGSAATLLARAQQQKELAAKPPKPTTLPEEIRPHGKPKDLPR